MADPHVFLHIFSWIRPMTTLVAAEAASSPAAGQLTVRAATAADDVFVDELQAIAFGPGRFARTAFRVREMFPIDPSLSLIAEVDGTACGSVWMTPISVDGHKGYLLGPLATHPNFRKRGAGKLLAREVAKLALARGEGEFVLLVGDQLTDYSQVLKDREAGLGLPTLYAMSGELSKYFILLPNAAYGYWRDRITGRGGEAEKLDRVRTFIEQRVRRP